MFTFHAFQQGGFMKPGNSKTITKPFDVAVVMPTIVRPSLLEALKSVYGQTFEGSVQILVGVDSLQGEKSILDRLEEGIPDRMTLTLFDPGYSTSSRHGGVHSARDGGALRTLLSFLAHSRYVAYLDDDNLWHPNHLSHTLNAIEGHDWAYSLRWLVDEDTNRKLTIDKWHSVGPGKGIMQGTSGGFVDPNTLIVDKLACADQLYLWSVEAKGREVFAGADRNFFDGLARHKSSNGSKRATVYYKMRRTNILWNMSMRNGSKKRPRNRPNALLRQQTIKIGDGLLQSFRQRNGWFPIQQIAGFRNIRAALQRIILRQGVKGQFRCRAC